MRKRKTHIHLPLKIPQNIIDCFLDYYNWRQDQSKYKYGRKDEILKNLDKACVKWHLYETWEAMVGFFVIYTTCGIKIICNTANLKPVVNQRCAGSDLFKEQQTINVPDDDNTECSYKKQTFVYHWKGYKDTPLSLWDADSRGAKK